MLWLILLILCWPIALLALLCWPVLWVLSIPFRCVGVVLQAAFALIAAVLFLPARLLRGARSH